MPPKLIQPANLNVGNFDAQLIGDVDPARYPHGLELAVFAPGGLEPIGKVVLPAGAMLFAVRPEHAANMRAVIRRQTAGANPLTSD